MAIRPYRESRPGSTPRSSVADYWDGDTPWITASSLQEFHIRDSEPGSHRLGLRMATTLWPYRLSCLLFAVRVSRQSFEYGLLAALRDTLLPNPVSGGVARAASGTHREKVRVMSDPERHRRRSIRLRRYDCSRVGAYFVSICIQGRLCCFGDAVSAQIGAHTQVRPDNHRPWRLPTCRQSGNGSKR
jgi:hypothetical protein